MANHDEPRREVPHELYPEWTTTPHAVHAKDMPRPVDTRGERTAWGSLAALGLLVVSIALLLLFLGRGRLQQRPSYEPPDAQIEVAARARLAREPEVATLPVTVVVREQIVTVSGRVPDERARERILNVVRMTPNVTGVIDHITVTVPRE